MKVLFYAVNGLGLGHLVRLLAIARKLRLLAPRAELLFLTSSEADSLVYREGFAALKVPSKNIREESGLRKKTFVRLIHTVVWNVVSSYSPDVLVVDTFPLGNLQELVPILGWEMGKVFVFREQRPEMARRPAVQNSLRRYDRVIVPHDETEDPPVPAGVDVAKVGPILIRDREEVLSREEARRVLGIPADRQVVYASFGGGGDPEVERCLSLVLEAAREHGDLYAVLAPGPLYRRDRQEGPGKRAAAALAAMEGRTTTLDHFPAVEVFRAFDLAVSGVGYNSSHELLHVGVPGAFIPFHRVVDDQGARARWIAEREAGINIPAPDLEAVRAALGQLLDPAVRSRISRRARRLVPDNGAERAAQAILEVAQAR